MARIIIVFILLVFSISCTRSVDTEATLSFQFKNVASNPGASAVTSGFYPSMIIINVKYDGQNHFQQWQCPYSHDEVDGYELSDCASVVPSNLVLTKSFPAGASRLVQVLLVYENESDQIEFYYTDKTVSFTGGQLNLVMGDTGWQQSSSATQGKVQGRLASSTLNVSSLNGRVVGLYQPADINKPPMEVIQETIFGGWFDFMFLSGVKFTYKHKETGRILFDKKSLEDISALALSSPNNQVTKIRVPEHYDVHSYIEEAEIVPANTGISGWNNSNCGTDYICLFDGVTTVAGGYLDTPGSSGTLDIEFLSPINVSKVDLGFATSGPVSNSINMEFTVPVPLATPASTPTPLSISAGAPVASDSANLDLFNYFTNKVSNIVFSLPNDSNFKITELTVVRDVYESYRVAETFVYVGFYNIDAQAFKTGNDAANGVNRPIPVPTPYFNGNGRPVKAVNEPVIDSNGTWEDKGDIMSSTANFLKFDGGSSGGNNYSVLITPSAWATSCGTGTPFTNTCVYIDPEKFRGDDILAFEGPLQDSMRMTCGSLETDPCSVSYDLLPGASMSMQFFVLPQASSHQEDEDFDCLGAEAAGYGVGSSSTSPLPSNANITQRNLSDGKVFFCPFITVSGGKKYLGWGQRLYYMPL